MRKAFPLSMIAAQLTLLSLLVITASAFSSEAADRLVLRYRAAHETADVEALKSLVYWEGVADRTREIIEGRLKKYLALPIKEIEFRPLSGDEMFGVSGYRPNLEPVGWLAISFEPLPENSRFLGTVFVVGENNGELFISAATPAR